MQHGLFVGNSKSAAWGETHLKSRRLNYKTRLWLRNWIVLFGSVHSDRNHLTFATTQRRQKTLLLAKSVKSVTWQKTCCTGERECSADLSLSLHAAVFMKVERLRLCGAKSENKTLSLRLTRLTLPKRTWRPGNMLRAVSLTLTHHNRRFNLLRLEIYREYGSLTWWEGCNPWLLGHMQPYTKGPRRSWPIVFHGYISHKFLKVLFHLSDVWR